MYSSKTYESKIISLEIYVINLLYIQSKIGQVISQYEPNKLNHK